MKEKLWTELYRPKKVADCIFPKGLLDKFSSFVAASFVPNLLLSGRAGVGKTTVAMAMLDELGADYLLINASLQSNIDVLRTDITQFASSVSFGGAGRKYVILDEADYLNPHSTQPALRSFMEEYSANCGFILTCNFPNRIIEPIRESRLAHIDFSIPRDEVPGMMAAQLKRACMILETEKVTYERPLVAKLVTKYFPDFRKVITELQANSHGGQLSENALRKRSEIDPLVDLIKGRDFTGMRKWVGENVDLDSTAIMRDFYDRCVDLMEPHQLAVLVLLYGRYQYQAAFVADQELNLVAFFSEVMRDCTFR